MIKETSIVTSTKVSKYAVAFVAAGGIIWVFSAVFYSAEIARCFSNLFIGFPSCSSVVLPSSSSTAGFPPQAVHWLAWDDLYANLYIGAIGLLAIAIGLTGLRLGRKWGWYSILIFVLAGVLTSFLDDLSWGGWYTFLFLGLPPLLGLVFSANIIFPRKSSSANPL